MLFNSLTTLRTNTLYTYKIKDITYTFIVTKTYKKLYRYILYSKRLLRTELVYKSVTSSYSTRALILSVNYI